MSDRTKTIVVSAVIVALIYVAAEFYIKPKVSSTVGVRIK